MVRFLLALGGVMVHLHHHVVSSVGSPIDFHNAHADLHPFLYINDVICARVFTDSLRKLAWPKLVGVDAQCHQFSSGSSNNDGSNHVM